MQKQTFATKVIFWTLLSAGQMFFFQPHPPWALRKFPSQGPCSRAGIICPATGPLVKKIIGQNVARMTRPKLRPKLRRASEVHVFLWTSDFVQRKKSSQMARSKVPNGNFPSPYQKKTHRNPFFNVLKVLQPPFIFFSNVQVVFFLVQMSLSKKLITVWIQAKLAQGRLRRGRGRNLCCISTFSWREAETNRGSSTGRRGWKNRPFFIWVEIQK